MSSESGPATTDCDGVVDLDASEVDVVADNDDASAVAGADEEHRGFSRGDAFVLFSLIGYAAIGGLLAWLLTTGTGESSPDDPRRAQGGPIQGALIETHYPDLPEIPPQNLFQGPDTPAPAVNGNSGDLPADLFDGDYLRLSFDELSSWEFNSATFEQIWNNPRLAKDFTPPPSGVLALDGTKIVIVGFAAPDDYRIAGVENFTLFRDLGACCFGDIPSLNHYIVCRTRGGEGVNIVRGMPTAVFGTLSVKVELDEEGYPISLYRMAVDRVEDFRPRRRGR